MADLDYDDDDDAFTAKSKTKTAEIEKTEEKVDTHDADREKGLQKHWGHASDRLRAGFQLGNILTDLEKKTLPLESATLVTTPWVSLSSRGLLCIACKRAGLTTPWGRGEAGKESKDLGGLFKSAYCKRHEKSTAHRTAVRMMLLVDDAPAAPSAMDFRTLLQSLQSGKAMREIHGSSYSDKTALMTWVLNETLLEKERDYMGKSCTVSLARDARRARLLIKFGICTATFEARAGVLGMSLGGGDRGGDIVRQTRKLIQRFCTKFAGKPSRWSCGPEPQFMEDLFNHMTSKIEIIMSDSAANEILAGLGFV